MVKMNENEAGKARAVRLGVCMHAEGGSTCFRKLNRRQECKKHGGNIWTKAT